MAAERAVTADALPAALGRPALRALAAAGLSTLPEVARLTERDLLALHGVGPTAVRRLREALAARGLTLRPG
ncbi:DNA-binding protein [Deinococcus arcticus]|uniref:DNA-binding protein n=1 Tax=Deinococcus arcticus TaxID=2136176 RepID=A0A2T3W6A5_9DEIO|nr:DNA-binding protein [Deinococcus arcticus]